MVASEFPAIPKSSKRKLTLVPDLCSPPVQCNLSTCSSKLDISKCGKPHRATQWLSDATIPRYTAQQNASLDPSQDNDNNFLTSKVQTCLIYVSGLITAENMA